MKTAATAARAGDCEQVIQLDANVCTLDPDLHDSVFVRDVGIARCISARKCMAAGSGF